MFLESSRFPMMGFGPIPADSQYYFARVTIAFAYALVL